MELIVGGRNQGKLKYAMDKHKVSKDEVFFAEKQKLDHAIL